MSEFNFNTERWDEPQDDPLEAPDRKRAVAISQHGERAVAVGDESAEEWLVAEQGARELEACV